MVGSLHKRRFDTPCYTTCILIFCHYLHTRNTSFFGVSTCCKGQNEPTVGMGSSASGKPPYVRMRKVSSWWILVPVSKQEDVFNGRGRGTTEVDDFECTGIWGIGEAALLRRSVLCILEISVGEHLERRRELRVGLSMLLVVRWERMLAYNFVHIINGDKLGSWWKTYNTYVLCSFQLSE